MQVCDVTLRNRKGVEQSPRSSEEEQVLRPSLSGISIFSAPRLVLKHFSQAFLEGFFGIMEYILARQVLIWLCISLAVLSYLAYTVKGVYTPFLQSTFETMEFICWWVLLGVLSSVGLGTGLHTFVLYLGPLVAKTAFAATECGTLAFDITGEHAFRCPSNLFADESITFLDILFKVQLASFFWGLGTAIGELPPYFIARAGSTDEIDTAEPEEEDTFISRSISMAKRVLSCMLHRYHFWAIVICASIPNPLFDMAGFTCGHFGISFWTFFGATVLGKAVIKVHLQVALVILVCSKHHVEHIIEYFGILPSLEKSIRSYIDEQKQAFHLQSEAATPSKSILGFVWDAFMLVMVLWFLKTALESIAREHMMSKRKHSMSKKLSDAVSATEEGRSSSTSESARSASYQNSSNL